MHAMNAFVGVLSRAMSLLWRCDAAAPGCHIAAAATGVVPSFETALLDSGQLKVVGCTILTVGSSQRSDFYVVTSLGSWNHKCSIASEA
jgi:hypothetical protein